VKTVETEIFEYTNSHESLSYLVCPSPALPAILTLNSIYVMPLFHELPIPNRR
jgi:hypothetical protein